MPPVPESLLEQLHEINIPSLYAPEMSEKDRAGLVKLAKQKLKLVKKQLREEMDLINVSYG